MEFTEEKAYKHSKKKHIIKNLVENVFSLIKRKFGGANKSKSRKLRNKETRLKTLIYNIHRSNQIQNRISTEPKNVKKRRRNIILNSLLNEDIQNKVSNEKKTIDLFTLLFSTLKSNRTILEK